MKNTLVAYLFETARQCQSVMNERMALSGGNYMPCRTAHYSKCCYSYDLERVLILCGARSRVVCERGCPTLAEITDKSHFLHTRSCCYSVKTARISLSLSSVYSSSPTLIVWPPKLGRRTLSPVFTLVGIAFPFLSLAPGPTAMTCASGLFFSVADAGKKMPEAVCEGDISHQLFE